jgi:hypothetical protein
VFAVVIAGVAVAAEPAGIAMAAGPSLTIKSPISGLVTNDRTPTFEGSSAEEGDGVVRLAIRTAEGTEVERPQMKMSEETWRGTVEALPDGTYTAVAEEEESQGPAATLTSAAVTFTSAPVTFTIDTTPPIVTLTSPANGSSVSNGSESVSGSAEGGQSVTIQLFMGSQSGPAPVEDLTVAVTGGGWSGTFGGLAPGTYTVRAEQLDAAHNLGLSNSSTFTVAAPPAPAVVPPPTASFRWFPAAPRTGENVSLVSSSTDTVRPITSFAWSLTGNGVFHVGGPVGTTSFSTPGNHVVQLRVTDSGGLSSIATETITVSSVPLILMQPFPIVRIAGSQTSSGVDLSLLTAQAPVGARVSVSCQGRGCPAKAVSRVATSRKKKGSVVVVEFPRFERALRVGVVLEIRISKPGEIGKFTRFVVRRHKLPERDDACLGPAQAKPIVCPSS